MNVILDMDETLITHKINPYSIFADPIPRPHLKEFLLFLFSNCKNVSIWTHGIKPWYNIVYNKILKNFIPEGKSFGFITDSFIHPNLVSKYKLVDGQEFSGKVIKSYNQEKKQWSWKLF